MPSDLRNGSKQLFPLRLCGQAESHADDDQQNENQAHVRYQPQGTCQPTA
jgi:hypothetical protein